ncbi:hypothetical protein RHMOL_Rhmol03G0286800 [Rhododendron molle]|uniref:Uncharacterized protein n=1 Tax=Rhododendron molle TaxID=49168 RepID=A0ACC0PL00_RHOML|nr:hypothetical protein RHMOL_Rhmol03G0286800 [Rhododendron molle]
MADENWRGSPVTVDGRRGSPEVGRGSTVAVGGCRQGDAVIGLGLPAGTVHSRLTLFTIVTEVGEAVRVRIYGGLGFSSDTISSRSTGILGSIMPESVNDALDPAHHHVLHNGFPAGVKSYAVIRKVDKVADSIAESVACRVTVSIITSSGYFLEYTLSINHQSESSWILEREFNLLTVIFEGTFNS